MRIEHGRAAVALSLVSSFMVYVDGTIANLILPQLSAHLPSSRADLEWVINAYTLGFAAVMLGAGAITDALGARRTFVTGLVVFTGSSAACAIADTMPVLNVARLTQGVGAAMLLPSALVLATAAATDEHARHRLVGWWAAAGGLGMAAGPLLGGALVSMASWRAVFAVNVAVGVPALMWAVRSMPRTARRTRTLDLPGMGTATVLIAGLVFGLVEGPDLGWASPAVVAALGLAIAGAVGFSQAERRVSDPLLPTAVYSDRSFLTAAGQGALFNFTFYGLLFAMSLMLQQGRGLSALESGLLFLPLTGLISAGSLCAAALTRRVGRRVTLVAGQLLVTAALVATAATSTLAALWPLAIALLPAGFGAGVLVPTMTAQSISAVPATLHGAASAAFNTSRQLGAAIGVATFGPLLGSTGRVGSGFITCVVAAAGATVLAFLLTLVGRTDQVPPARPSTTPHAAAGTVRLLTRVDRRTQ